MAGEHAGHRAEQPLRTIHEIKPDSFIFEQPNSLSERFCAEVIRHFEDAKDEHYEGRIGQLADKNSSIKKSTDLVVSGKTHWKNADQTFFRALGLAIREFRERYPFFKGPFKDMGYGIQRTRAGEHYH